MTKTLTNRIFNVARSISVRLMSNAIAFDPEQEKYTSHCKRTNKLHFKPKKITVDKALVSVRAILLQLAAENRGTEYPDSICVHAEDLAIYLNIETHIIKQCFHALNLEGLIGQRNNWVSGNCGRVNTYNEYSGWWASRYFINLEKCLKEINDDTAN